MKVVIIGSGGHGAVVADILLRMAEAGDRIEPVAFLDDAPLPNVRQISQVPVICGGLSGLRRITHDAVIVAIGDNALRRRLSDELRRNGTRLAIARHPSSVVAPDVCIGGGTMICAGAIVSPAARIGCSVILNTHSSVDHHNAIGDYVHIGPGVRLGGNVSEWRRNPDWHRQHGHATAADRFRGCRWRRRCRHQESRRRCRRGRLAGSRATRHRHDPCRIH